MPVEEQIQNNDFQRLYTTGMNRVGQKLTIPNREVTKLAFLLKKIGNPPGDVTFTIRKVSDDSLIVSKVWGAANTLPVGTDWVEATFGAPETIDEAVRIACEYNEGNTSNDIDMRCQNTDVKPGEQFTYFPNGGAWTEMAWDCAYRYTYSEEEAGLENKSANMGPKMMAAGLI